MRHVAHGSFSAFGTVILLALSGLSCKQGPEYTRPLLDVPAAYKTAATQPAEPPRLGQNWWELFNDPQLNTLEQEAIQNNQDVIAAMMRVLESRAASLAVRSQFFPTINLNGSILRSHPPTSGGRRLSPIGPRPNVVTLENWFSGLGGQLGQSIANVQTGQAVVPGAKVPAAGTASRNPLAVNSTDNNTQLGLDLSYEVDVWGRVARSYEASQAQVLVSVDDFSVVLLTMESELAQDYFTLRSLDAQAQILARNIQLYEKQVVLTRTQKKAGLVGEPDVLQAETLLNSTRTLELEVRRQRADMEHAIAILLGRPPSELTLKENPLDVPPPAIPSGLPSDLLDRRPDVAEAEENLAAACAQIGVAKANFFPVIKLTGAAGYASIDIQHAVDWHSALWNFGPSISFPLFQGGQLEANLRQAKAKYQESLANYKSSLLQAFKDVEDSLNDLKYQAEEVKFQEMAVAESSEYLRLILLQYEKAGLVTYLIVIDAERTLLTNELAAEQVRNQRMVSAVLLIKALGGGWDAEAAAASQPAVPFCPPYQPLGIDPKDPTMTNPGL